MFKCNDIDFSYSPCYNLTRANTYFFGIFENISKNHIFLFIWIGANILNKTLEICDFYNSIVKVVNWLRAGEYADQI